MADQQVLWFAHQRAHAAQCSADRTVHQQAAQEGAELVEVFSVQLRDLLVAVERALLTRVGTRGNAVKDRVEAYRSADDHRRDCQRIEKGREER
ncbi:hypothetical protein D3C76_1433530 [compost metagenome]